MLEIIDEKYKEILEQLDKNCCFTEDIFKGSYQDLIINPLKEANCFSNWTYDSGATKLVLLFSGMDSVIKIPFAGSDEDYYIDGDLNCSCPQGHSSIKNSVRVCTKCYNCSYYNCPRRGHYEFTNFYGANAENGWDYCEAEINYYQDALDANVEDFFAKTWLIGYVNGYPIYAQHRAEMFEGTSSTKKYSKEKTDAVMKYCDDMDLWCFNEYWLSDFKDFFGEDAIEKLLSFLVSKSIEDLHDGNLGYVNGVPVIVDYAGYSN